MAKENNGLDKEIKFLQSVVDEFKTFISRGNVVDLAVGVIIGGAFGKIVSSLVDDMIMPLIGVLLGGLDFSTLSIKIGDASITYGNFLQNIIDFLIIAASICVLVKVINRLNPKTPKKDEKAKTDEKLDVLKEILSEIRKSKK